MAHLPGMLGDVYWGDPERPLPNWREHPRPDGDEDDPPDRPLSDDEYEHLKAITGIDPRELWPDEGDDEREADEPD